MPGPRPKPAAVKAQQAPIRSRHQSKPDLMPRDSQATTSSPAWLKDEGLKIWRRLAPNLTRAKLLTAADRETFGRYCFNFARWLAMQRLLDAGSMTYTVETESGVVHRTRPEFTIADRIERQLLAAEDRFGLNPAERQRIFAARSQSGYTGDLFHVSSGRQQRSADDPAAPPTQPAEPSEDAPIGFLQ